MDIGKIKDVLRQKAGFEVIRERVAPGSVEMIGRLHNGTDPFWLVARSMLVAAKGKSWSCEFAVVGSIDERDLLVTFRRVKFVGDFQVEQLERLLAGAPKARVVVQSASLPGVRSTGQNPNGRGASYNPVLGAAAKAIITSRLGGR